MASHHPMGYESWTLLLRVIASRWLRPGCSKRLAGVSGRARELQRDATQARSQAANIQLRVLGHTHLLSSCNSLIKALAICLRADLIPINGGLFASVCPIVLPQVAVGHPKLLCSGPTSTKNPRSNSIMFSG